MVRVVRGKMKEYDTKHVVVFSQGNLWNGADIVVIILFVLFLIGFVCFAMCSKTKKKPTYTIMSDFDNEEDLMIDR